MSYIKLQDAKNAIMNCITEQTVSKYATSAECRSARHGADIALFALDDLPTADVVEVRHGEWVVDAYKGDEIVRIPYQVHEHDEPYCSLCGTYALLDEKEDYVPSNFCPRCGAKMGGEKQSG